MQIVLSSAQMRALEQRYMKTAAVSEEALILRAANELITVIDELLDGCAGHVAAFACGKGNNGADGRICAAKFEERGGRAFVIERADQLDALPRPELWVDALFGIGLSRPVEGENARIIERMNSDKMLGSTILSVDIPSGLHADSGRILGAAVSANVTVSFQYPKLGHYLLDGADCVGELVVKSVGIDSPLEGNEASLVELPDLQAMLKPRRHNSHKGTYGHLLLVAGSRGMAGAAVLSAAAALKSGCGLVTIACPESILPIVQMKVPCALCLPLPENEQGAIADAALPVLSACLEKVDAVAIGPGLSLHTSSTILKAVLTSPLPAVIDADALNLVSADDALKKLFCSRHLITPHPGEAARLLRRGMDAPVSDAVALHALGAIALLKGATTVVAGEGIHLCQSGSPGMAKGGSGDVLTGIAGALLAQGYAVEEAAILASELNGRAGDDAAARCGVYSMTAEDTIGRLGEAFRLVW